MAHGAWRMAHGARRKAHGAWRMAHGTWHMAYGAWRMAHDAWRMAHGAWRMAHGARGMTHGAWRMAHGAWRMADGTWHMGVSLSQALGPSLVLQAPPRVAPLVTQLQPPTALGKRALSDSQKVRNKKSKTNRWWCTCTNILMWPPARDGGRQWHQTGCPRQRWADGRLVGDPQVGERITITNHPSAGRCGTFEHTGKGKWPRVVG